MVATVMIELATDPLSPPIRRADSFKTDAIGFLAGCLSVGGRIPQIQMALGGEFLVPVPQ
jgi:hypothetical protein